MASEAGTANISDHRWGAAGTETLTYLQKEGSVPCIAALTRRAQGPEFQSPAPGCEKDIYKKNER